MNQKVVIGIVVLVAALGLFKFMSSPSNPPAETAPASAPADAAAQAPQSEAPAAAAPAGGLQMEDIKVGDGAEAVAGKVAVVHYVGTLTNGTKFDSSRDRNQPFEFALGAGQVIKGWDQGVQGMKIGGVRKLTIPPELGYGEAGAGAAIPPNSTLVFEVELLGVK